MSLLKIAKLGHPVLVKKTNEINNLEDIDLKKIVIDMSETMLDANGIGLAAPQVYLTHRMFIYINPDSLKYIFMTEISIVVPVRNEEESIKPFLERTV